MLPLLVRRQRPINPVLYYPRRVVAVGERAHRHRVILSKSSDGEPFKYNEILMRSRVYLNYTENDIMTAKGIHYHI